MKKNFTKFVACLLLVLTVLSIIEPMNIIVLAEELETNAELQINNVDETTNLLDEKLLDEQKLLEIESESEPELKHSDLSYLNEEEILQEANNTEDIIEELAPKQTEELPQVDSLNESSPDNLEKETWGDCSFTFDENTGIITVKEGTLSPEFPITLDKSVVRKIKLESGVKAPEDSSYLFANMGNLEEIEGSLDISNTWNMEGMFYGDINLKSLDFSDWDTSNVSNMLNMLSGTNSLQTIIMGEKSIFDNSTGLPMIDISSTEYSGRWICINPENPTSVYENSDEFLDNYDGSNPGVYIWELNTIEELEGWQKENGHWYYYDSGIARIGWHEIENNQYYFNNDGVMQTGWLYQESTWYYFRSSGAMATNWVKVGNTWYYLNSNGAMQTGWLYQENTWYYFKSSGAMATNWVKVGNTWYYLNSNGAMQTGWLYQENTWYYLKSSGAMATGWLKQGNIWYYLKSSGAMATGWLKQGNIWYYLKSSGAMATNWAKVGNTWYYLNSNGAMQTGWLYQGNIWYYLKSSGAMATGWLYQGNTWYYLKSSGAMATGWLKQGNIWYYLKSSGAMVTNLFKIKDIWYYFDNNGVMQIEYKGAVLLDPGHGGSESGAYEYGVAEKKLNLHIANLVRDDLEKLGYLVIMTRTDDTELSLLDRSKFSNELEPDVFVSIHHNAMPNNLTQVNGIVTFYYEYDSDYPPKINEEMHNDPIRLEKSRLLSESIQSSLISNTGAVNMGVDRNTFAVLRETAVPATLVELGFMTNYNEFLKITNSNYQKKLANGIVNGIHQYFKF